MLTSILLSIQLLLSPQPAEAATSGDSATDTCDPDAGQWAEMNTCDSTYHCSRCNEDKTICDGCSSGEGPGDVFTCVGCYSGDSHCAIGASGSNSCCD